MKVFGSITDPLSIIHASKRDAGQQQQVEETIEPAVVHVHTEPGYVKTWRIAITAGVGIIGVLELLQLLL